MSAEGWRLRKARMTGVVNTTSPINRKRTRRMFNATLHPAASVFDGRLVDKHHRNVIFDRVHPAADITAKAGAILHHAYGFLAFGADKDLEQRGIDGHS